MASYVVPKVWHAFQALKETSNATKVPRSKLKVLNQNIGSVLKLDIVDHYEETFPDEEFKERGGVSFDEYENFLVTQVLTRVPLGPDPDEESRLAGGEMDSALLAAEPGDRRSMKVKSKKASASHQESDECNKITEMWRKLDDVCWLLYRGKAFPRPPQQLTSASLFGLWKLFNTYAKTVGAAGVIGVPVCMDGGEVEYWLTRLNELFAQNYERRVTVGETPEFLSFPEVVGRFVDFVESKNLVAGDVEMALQELTEEALDGVIRKGYLSRSKKAGHGGGRSNMITVWGVLTAKSFVLYTDEEKSEKKGIVAIRSNMTVEALSEKNDRGTKFQVISDDTTYLLEASDMRSRNQWLQDFNAAVRYRHDGVDNWAISEGRSRQQRRQDRREARRREIEQREKELIETRKKREIAERSLEEQKKKMEVIMKEKSIETEKQRKARKILELEHEELKKSLETQISQLLAQKQSDIQEHLIIIEQMKTEEQTLSEKLVKTEGEKDREYKARTELEARLQEETEQLENERVRISQLEEMRDRLQKALEEEKQARLDEEVVRKLQSKLLEEETEARTKLEEIHKEKEELLVDEKQHREKLEAELLEERKKMEEILSKKGYLNRKLEDNENRLGEQSQMITSMDNNLKAAQEEIKKLEQHIETTNKKNTETIACVEQESINKEAQLRREIEDTNEIQTRLKEESGWLKSQIHETSTQLDIVAKERDKIDKLNNSLEQRLTELQKYVLEKDNLLMEIQKTLDQERQDNKNVVFKKTEELNKEIVAREDAEKHQQDQEALLAGEIEKRAMIELEVSEQRNRSARLTRECRELQEKLQEAQLALQSSVQSHPTNEDTEAAIDEHETVSPQHPTTVEVETTLAAATHAAPTQGGWAAKFNLPFGNKNK